MPPRAQAAHQQATYLFDALRKRMDGRPVQPFAFKDLGSLVSLGHFSAVGSLLGGLIGGSMFIEGLMARLMYTSLYRMHVQQDESARQAALGPSSWPSRMSGSATMHLLR